MRGSYKEEAIAPTSPTLERNNIAHNNANTTITTVTTAPVTPPAQPPQVIIIPATPASTLATQAAKKIRRAFSMPRNPFGWSRKFKTCTEMNENMVTAGDDASDDRRSATLGVGGRGRAGSIVSLTSYEAVPLRDTLAATTTTTTTVTPQEGKSNGETVNSCHSAGTRKEDVVAGESSGPDKASGGKRVFRRSSLRKFFNRLAQHVSSSLGPHKHATVNVSHNSSASATGSAITTDRVPPIGGYQWPADQTPGVMGLKNHGNTCFMNAVLQCLSHTDILAEYFVLDQYKADLKRRNKLNSRKFGTKGELTEQLANVLKALWMCKNEGEHSTSFKAVVDRYGSQFRSSTQHDAQEFLFWLLDKVHEDLNTATKRRYKCIKNTYGRPDEVLAAETLANHIRCNNSFVQAVFQAQFRSSLTCPRCCKQSNTFDPFHCISVQLPQLQQQTLTVTVVYMTKQPRQMKIGLRVPAGSPIMTLREHLHSDTGIPRERMVLVDINQEGFSRVFFDTQPLATLKGLDSIYCIEVPETKKQKEEREQQKVSGESNGATTALKDGSSNRNETMSADTDLLLLVANVHKKRRIKKKPVEEEESKPAGEGANEGSARAKDNDDDAGEFVLERFGTPFSMLAPRDCSYTELQKKILREMSPQLKPEVFAYSTSLSEMFQMRLQDPSADPDTYLEQVEHPLLTEIIDLALSVLSSEAGPPHVKLLLEWSDPQQYFNDLSDVVVEHESVSKLQESKNNDTAPLTLEQCLEHYTKAETLSAEDAWRCPHCQQYLPVVKTLGLWSLPDILVVHFKRFRQHHEKGSNAAKLTTMVTFPLMAFDMSPHLARGNREEHANNENFLHATNTTASSSSSSSSQYYRPSQWKKSKAGGDSRSSTLSSRDNRETRYDLYAVCYHQGDTLETGHYTAACKNPYDRQWYKFDDQRVTKVPNDNIEEEIINNEAYMLFYQRRCGENENSGSSTNSIDHWVSKIAPAPVAVPQAVTAPASVAVPKDVEDSKDNMKNEENNETEEGKRKEDAKLEVIVKKPIEAPSQENAIDVKEAKTIGNAKDLQEAKETSLVDIEEIDFADADADADAEAEPTQSNEESNMEAMNNKNMDDEDEANRIFAMDEDCKQAEVQDRVPVEAANAAAVLVPSVPMANGLTTTSPRGDIKSRSASNTSVASSSSTSLATAAAPTSSSPQNPLEATTNGMPTSYNGYASNVNTDAMVNGYHHQSSNKEAPLSTSLKSNSSSIIAINSSGTGGGGGSHGTDFNLSRHQQYQWNGSRSSVSAVENASQRQAQSAAAHCVNLRHSFSTSSNYKFRECNDTLSSLLRNSTNTCSKDTLLFIDQPNHNSHHHHHHRSRNHNHHQHHGSLMEDEDDTFIGSRSLWISPVTPHKLITVSPKN